jgi:U3 small nucleolar ribonucleoprotein protein LCP5
MRPIDHKLKHQIDKLVKTAATGSAGGSDPSSFCAHPENMISKVEESEESESEHEDNNAGSKEDKTKKGVYVPPKLAAVHYGKYMFCLNLLLLTIVSLCSAQTCCCSK